MKKIKFFILASLFGLINTNFGNISATFVDPPKKTNEIEYDERKDYYQYADHLVDGMFFIKTVVYALRKLKKDDKVISLFQKSIRFYLPIDDRSFYNASADKSNIWLPKFDGPDGFYEFAKKFAGKAMWIDEELKMVYPINFIPQKYMSLRQPYTKLDSELEEFYKYLYESLLKANEKATDINEKPSSYSLWHGGSPYDAKLPEEEQAEQEEEENKFFGAEE